MDAKTKTPEQDVQTEHASLIGQLEAYEHVRERVRREGNWDQYSCACEQLAHLGRLLWLLKRNKDE